MRGILYVGYNVSNNIRITPACAGNTFGKLLGVITKKDHPRLCGEYLQTSTVSGKILGSPPPVRGILLDATLVALIGRITPACAGNTNLQENKL